MESNIIFRYVNIDEIYFIDNKNNIKFEFIDSLGMAAFCGSLTCLNVTTFKLSIAEDEDDVMLPQIVCDITADEKDSKSYVGFYGSHYDIEIACASIETVAVDDQVWSEKLFLLEDEAPPVDTLAHMFEGGTMEPRSIFTDVNMSEISFINFRNDIKFDFLESLGEAAHCGSLTCLNVTTFKLSIAEDEDDVELPQVVRDIVAVEKDGKTYVKFCGSSYNIEIACAEIVCENCGNN